MICDHCGARILYPEVMVIRTERFCSDYCADQHAEPAPGWERLRQEDLAACDRAGTAIKAIISGTFDEETDLKALSELVGRARALANIAADRRRA